MATDKGELLDWNKLQTFYHTVRIGSFAGAATELCLNQSSISRQMMLLEKSINHPLFNRRSRTVHLTEAGELLFQCVEQMFKEVNTAKSEVSDLQSKPEGWMIVATTAGISSRFLVKYAQKFTALQTAFKLKIMNSDHAPYFSPQEVDAVIVPLTGVPTDYCSEYIMTFEASLYASQDYLRIHGTPETLEDLDKHRLIIYGNHNHPYPKFDWFLSVGSDPNHIRLPHVELNSGTGILSLAEQGVGIAALDIEFGQHSNLVRILPKLKVPKVDIYYAYPRYLKNTKKIEVFGRFLKSVAEIENRMRQKVLNEK